MLKRGKMDRDVIEMVGIESLVLEEHLLRKIDKAVDFNQWWKSYTVRRTAGRA